MAMRMLGSDAGIRGLRLGPAIVTDPVVPDDVAGTHPSYLNTAIIGETTRSPEILMARLLSIETICGRRRRGTVDPRTLDLDLLVHEGATIARDGLEVPHPRLSGRRFVLEPLVGLLNALERSGEAVAARPCAAIREALAAAGVQESSLR
jgi:2-amino-4-hydroxy-6-hydroxymethyldihydropteridine diphosphokinase